MSGCYVTTKDLNTLAQVNMNEPSNSLAFIAASSSSLNALIKSCSVCAASTHRTWSSSLHLSTEQLQQHAEAYIKIIRIAWISRQEEKVAAITIFHDNLKCSLQECSSCGASTCELGYVLIASDVWPQCKMIHTAGKILICLMTGGLHLAIPAKCFLCQRGSQSMSLHTQWNRKEEAGKWKHSYLLRSSGKTQLLLIFRQGEEWGCSNKTKQFPLENKPK